MASTIGMGWCASLMTAALLGASKRIVFFFWRDATGKDEEPAVETLPDMLPLIVLAVVRFATLLRGIAGLIRTPPAEAAFHTSV
jgi:hypothetical protein